jgi:LacI family transcriptional regulator
MAEKSIPTIRSLAKTLRLSPTTVSDALRGVGRVDKTTAKRIRQLAEKVGYKSNPLTTALMSGFRRSRAATFRGVIAAVDINEPARFPHGPFPKQISAGARRRAIELGFHFEEFVAGHDALPLPRLDSILKSRGIHGVMIMPAWLAPDVSALDWSHYAGVYTDNFIEKPRLHTVCSDHYRSMMELLARLRARGYRRPGLMLEQGRDDRLLLRQSAAFRAFQESQVDEGERVPILFAREFAEKPFSAWFKRHQPDVVLNHYDDTVGWMEACGAKVPETHGYVCLNAINRTRPCAALDLQPQQLGARAVELLVGQLQRAEYGSPSWTTATMLTASWVDGPTLRASPPQPA